jgi:hypothetical protein
MNEDVKRTLIVALLVLTACGLGPSASGCRVQQQSLEEMEAGLQTAAAQRKDLAPYVAAIEQARAAAAAAGC